MAASIFKAYTCHIPLLGGSFLVRKEEASYALPLTFLAESESIIEPDANHCNGARRVADSGITQGSYVVQATSYKTDAFNRLPQDGCIAKQVLQRHHGRRSITCCLHSSLPDNFNNIRRTAVLQIPKRVQCPSFHQGNDHRSAHHHSVQCFSGAHRGRGGVHS